VRALDAEHRGAREPHARRWAFRLSHYGSITSDEYTHHAKCTARLIGLAGDHSNRGIRSFYHAIAALAWSFHALLFMTTTTWDVLILAPRLFRALVAAHCRQWARVNGAWCLCPLLLPKSMVGRLTIMLR
jgi:uncharacterized membrane protein